MPRGLLLLGAQIAAAATGGAGLGGCNRSSGSPLGAPVEFQPSRRGSAVRVSADGRTATAAPSLTLEATVVSTQAFVRGTHTFKVFGTAARGNKVVGVSLSESSNTHFLGFGADSWGFSSWSGNKIHNDSVGTGQPFSDDWGAGVEIDIILDADAGTLSFAVGGGAPKLAWRGLPTGAALRSAGGYRLAASMCCGQGVVVLGGGPQTGTRIVVNAANATGRATQKCSGFLCTSIWSNEPQDELLRPIKPRFINGQANWVETSEYPSLLADGVFERQVIDLNMTVLLRLESSYAPHFLNSDAWHWFDLHECNATSAADALGCRWPCDRGDCGRWEGWLRELVSRIEARAARWSVDPDRNVWYDPWNEVQNGAFNASGVGAGFWPRTMDQYRALWSSAHRTLKRLRPGAVVAGPSIAHFDFEWLTSFLLWTETNGTVPDALTWHEFGVDGNLIPGHVAEITAWLEAQPSPALRRLKDRLLVPENIYGPNTPAVTLSYIAAHERTTTLFMGHACWGDGGLDAVAPYSYVGGYVGCNQPRLNHLLTQDIVAQPRARWWVYERYASITGELVDVRINSEHVPAMAGVTSGVVRVLVGNTGSLAQNATVLEVVGATGWAAFVTVSAAYIPDTNDSAVPALATTVLQPRLATTRCAESEVDGRRCAVVTLQCLERASVLFVELAPAADEAE